MQNHGASISALPRIRALTEACFQATPMPFADDSSLMLSNGDGESPVDFRVGGDDTGGSTWLLPMTGVHPGGTAPEAWGFSPPCYEPRYPAERCPS